MKKKVKWILIGLIVLLSLGSYGAVLLKPVSITAETVKKGNLESRFTVTATVTPAHTMILNSYTQGTVTELPWKAGVAVPEGAVLLKTDAAPGASLDIQKEQYRQQLLNARRDYDRLYGANGSALSDLSAAKTRYSQAQKTYDNSLALFNGGALSQAELDAMKLEKDLAYENFLQAQENASESRKSYYKDQITSLEKQLSMLENTMSPGQVQMPYDGILWETYVEPGSYVVPNQAVARVYRPEEMKLEASVLSEDAVLLADGMTAQVSYADGSTGMATVAFVSRTASRKLSSIGLEENRCMVELKPDAMPDQVGAGQDADVTFSLIRAEGVFHVPASAIVPDGTKTAVYVVAGGKARRTEVEVGLKEGGRVEILSGLDEGDIIAADPYNDHIGEGKRVKISLYK